MTITYNKITYEVMPDSIFSDFSIIADSLENACEIVKSFDGMTEYTFNIDDYSNMVIVKRSIVVSDTGVVVKVKARSKSKAEIAQAELDALRQAMLDVADSASKTTASKINNILEKGVQ